MSLLVLETLCLGCAILLKLLNYSVTEYENHGVETRKINYANIPVLVGTKLSGNIFALTFKIKEDIEDSEVEIDCTVRIKALDENKVEQSLSVEVIPGKVTIANIIKGDVTGDDYVDSNDAIHLLYHTLIPERYEVNQNCDFNNDGFVDSNDAIYLLYHTLIPERYPLA